MVAPTIEDVGDHDGLRLDQVGNHRPLLEWNRAQPREQIVPWPPNEGNIADPLASHHRRAANRSAVAGSRLTSYSLR
jgi:hypothetical protein